VAAAYLLLRLATLIDFRADALHLVTFVVGLTVERLLARRVTAPIPGRP